MKTNIKNKLAILFHAIKHIDITLTIIFIIAVACLINYECLIITNPWHNNITTGLNKIIIQVFYAYITGLIFYFIIELLPREKVKVSILRLVINNTTQINSRIRTLLSEICKASNRNVDDQITYKEFTSYCDSLNIYSTTVKVWFIQERVSLREIVVKICNEVDDNVQRLTPYINMLDENWVNRMVNLSDGTRHILDKLDVNGKTSNLGLSCYWIWNLYLDAKLLDDLANNFFIENHKTYSKQKLSTWTGSQDKFFVVAQH